VLGARDIFIGANQIDYSGYPDCRARFFDAFEKVADAGTRPGQSWEIHAPLLHDSKARVVERGTALGVDFALTRSCYDPVGDQGLACGRCDSCQIRRRGFEAAGVVDPTRYAR
jgi:7-cyano-7-deazaguanine synthase